MATGFDKNLPNVNSWQPERKSAQTLKNALEITCQFAQRRVVLRACEEKRFVTHNFDSGPGVEDIVRDELSSLLPRRYSIEPGVVSDSRGNSAGDCDLVIRDSIWSSAVKPGATHMSRRYHFPIEGIYSVSEIKQTLGYGELDCAMQKLVTVSRLERPNNPYGHITENQHLLQFDQQGKILNPLHTSIIAVGLPKGISFRDVVLRFGKINAQLTRDDMVNMLCVLDCGTAWYSVESGSPYNADYMRDRDRKLILQLNDQEPQNTFYRLYCELIGHLTRSVLNITKIDHKYGKPPPPRCTMTYNSATFNNDLDSNCIESPTSITAGTVSPEEASA